MTRKHFQLIADHLNYTRPEASWCPNKRLQWKMDVKAIANACQASNSNFDRERFLKACGLYELEEKEKQVA
jgi:hypothetical protein